MILYLDPSALVKLYVAEEGSSEVRRRVAGSEAAATSRLAYPEARSALARRHREGGMSAPSLRRSVAAMDRDLSAFLTVEFRDSVARLAGDLAEKHGLRGSDGVHLASALELSRLSGRTVVFLTFDARQARAAASEGLAAPGKTE